MDRSFFNIINQSTFSRRWRYELPNFLPVTSGTVDCSSKTDYLSSGLGGESFLSPTLHKFKAKYFLKKLFEESYVYKKLKKRKSKRKQKHSRLVVKPKQFTMSVLNQHTQWVGYVDFGFELQGLGVALLPDNVFTAFSIKVVDGDVIKAEPIEVWIRSGRLWYYVAGLGIVRHGTVYLGNRAYINTDRISIKSRRSLEKVRCALLKKKIRKKSTRNYKKKFKRSLRKSYFVWLVARINKLGGKSINSSQSDLKVSDLKKRLVFKSKRFGSKLKWQLRVRRKLKMQKKFNRKSYKKIFSKQNTKFRRYRKFKFWFRKTKSRWTRNWFRSYRIKFDRIKLRNKKRKLRKNMRWNKIFKIFKRKSKFTFDLRQKFFIIKNQVFARRYLLKTLKFLKWRNNALRSKSSLYSLWRRSAFVNYKLVKMHYTMFYLPGVMKPTRISWWNINYEPSAKGKFVRKKTKSGRIYKRLNSVLRVL